MAVLFGTSQVKVVDLDTGDIRCTFSGPTPGTISQMAWGPDARYLATGGRAGPVQVWDCSDGKQVRAFTLRIPTPRVPTQAVFGSDPVLAWSPDGRWLAAGLSYSSAPREPPHSWALKVWDPATGREECAGDGFGDHISRLVWSPDGRRLAAEANDGEVVRVLDRATGKALLSRDGSGSPPARRTLAWGPDGKRLAVAWAGLGLGGVEVWEVEGDGLRPGFHARRPADTPAPPRPTPAGPRPMVLGRMVPVGTTFLAWSPDGRRLAQAVAMPQGTEVGVWNATSGEEVARPGAGNDALDWWGWSPDGRRLGLLGRNGALTLWDADDPGRPVTLGIPRAEVDQVVEQAWSPDGTCLATGSRRGVVKLRAASAGSDVRTLAGPRAGIRCLAWSRDSRLLAAADASGSVKVWDRATGKELIQFRYEVRDTTAGPVTNLAWDPAGNRLAVAGDDGAVMIYDPATGQETRTLRGPSARTSIAWSPDGRRLASAAPQDGIKVWELETGQELLTLPNCQPPLAWSPDGWRLEALESALYPQGTIAVWDATPPGR
jgi:WD40 repeat protein